MRFHSMRTVNTSQRMERTARWECTQRHQYIVTGMYTIYIRIGVRQPFDSSIFIVDQKLRLNFIATEFDVIVLCCWELREKKTKRQIHEHIWWISPIHWTELIWFCYMRIEYQKKKEKTIVFGIQSEYIISGILV